LIFAETAPYSELAASQADVACEPVGLLPQHPSLRPTDILLRVFPGALTVSLTAHHIAVDVTSIPHAPALTDPIATDDAYLTSVIRHHES
jgi:hypothetical protein